ncbi:HAD family hydrolase [Streptomyces thermodiastaticus]|jgi:HAD superfamily hydrolase (TIGR01509 family)|uniref:HAD family hydrolase n=1 Tax=Streptomyces thermodiastaticus TaxID=44061 RepID=UPI001672E9B8|nr:HAD family phosphatase [Streptomyces thermodiastaticus]MCE7553322.1 HAD family phosphatase [Streptomyces thermodiastaticus]GHF96158.1 hydrolase [Streptomyces thermodiastaticus]
MTRIPALDPDWTPEAVVFDCDGTLIDSEQHWQRARAIVLRAFGHAPDEEFAQRAKGLHYRDCGALMAELVGAPEHAEDMTQQLLSAFRSLVAREPVTTPGARELVWTLQRVAPLAVASNCPEDVVRFSLESVDLLKYVRHIVVPDDSIRPKPHPDTYAEAVRRLGVPGSNALAVEDSVNGMKAAVAAGLRVVGLGPRPATQDAALADLWVDSLDDPALMDWAASRPTSRPGRPETRAGDTADAKVPRPGGPTRQDPAGAS